MKQLKSGFRFAIETDGSLLIQELQDRKTETDAGSYHCAATWEGQIIHSRKCIVQIAGQSCLP